MKHLKMVWNWLFRKVIVWNNKQRFLEVKQEKKDKNIFKPGDMLTSLTGYLLERYDFRYNLLTEETEFRNKQIMDSYFAPIGQRELNSFCMDARQEGINCWDRDISRYVYSDKIIGYHPFNLYMEELPEWDGVDRVTELAGRIASEKVWTRGFHRWMLALAAQWMGLEQTHANSVAPVLVSLQQGKHKSTFCKMLLPQTLQRYYTDSYDLSAPTQAEQKLAEFGLINLDEMDKISVKRMPLLKNLMQMSGLNIRKAHKKNYRPMPRIASFIATSNRKELLTDPSGSRRFLCVELTRQIDCTNINHSQIYAQLKSELINGKPYWFNNEEEAEIMQNNTPFYRQDTEISLFQTKFRNAKHGESCLLLSAGEIFNQLKQDAPSIMNNSSLYTLGRILTTLGTERVHTQRGNLYRVIAKP